ncbi:MAG: hypothetical protein J5767_12670 [Paludibacteraceae bacterium]|nr:hypothetical protein [Paludibacteraceae bacterium]
MSILDLTKFAPEVVDPFMYDGRDPFITEKNYQKLLDDYMQKHDISYKELFEKTKSPKTNPFSANMARWFRGCELLSIL